MSSSSNHVRAVFYNSVQICFLQGGGPEVLFRWSPVPHMMPPTWRAPIARPTAKRDGDTLRMGASTALETRRPPQSRTRTAHRIATDRWRQQARPGVFAGARTTAEGLWFSGMWFFWVPFPFFLFSTISNNCYSESCTRWSHLTCLGYKRKTLPKVFVCAFCIDRTPRALKRVKSLPSLYAAH